MSIPVRRNQSLPNQQARLRLRILCQWCPRTGCRLQRRGIESDLRLGREPRYQCLHLLILLLPAGQAQANCTRQSNQLERKAVFANLMALFITSIRVIWKCVGPYGIHRLDLDKSRTSFKVSSRCKYFKPCYSKVAYYYMLSTFKANSHASQSLCDKPREKKGKQRYHKGITKADRMHQSFATNAISPQCTLFCRAGVDRRRSLQSISGPICCFQCRPASSRACALVLIVDFPWTLLKASTAICSTGKIMVPLRALRSPITEG